MALASVKKAAVKSRLEGHWVHREAVSGEQPRQRRVRAAGFSNLGHQHTLACGGPRNPERR
jgi:hypothetical protein